MRAVFRPRATQENSAKRHTMYAIEFGPGGHTTVMSAGVFEKMFFSQPTTRRWRHRAAHGDPGKRRVTCATQWGASENGPRRMQHRATQKIIPRSPQGPLQVTTEARVPARGPENRRLQTAVPSLSAWVLEKRLFSQPPTRSDARRSKHCDLGPLRTVFSCPLSGLFRGDGNTHKHTHSPAQELRTCKSFGRGLRKLCFLTSPSSLRPPGVFPGRGHTQMHFPSFCSWKAPKPPPSGGHFLSFCSYGALRPPPSVGHFPTFCS